VNKVEDQIQKLRAIRKQLAEVLSEEDMHDAITAMLATADDLICKSINAMRNDF
jgi:hypothetical protein